MLELRGGPSSGDAKFVLDHPGEGQITGDGGFPVGDDGFRDAGLRLVPRLMCDPVTQCGDESAAPGFDLRVMSALNTGKLTLIYLRDSDAIIDDTHADDSLLYVGFDIFNGDARIVGTGATEDRDYHRIDFLNLGDPFSICDDGIRPLPSDPNIPRFCAVPFDTDADGDPQTTDRWADLQPQCPRPPGLADTGQEFYSVQLFSCGSVDIKSPDFLGEVAIEMFTRFDPVDEVRLESTFLPLPPDLAAVGVEVFPAEHTLPAGLMVSDVEFVIRGVDTLYNYLSDGDLNNYDDDRFKVYSGALRTMSDTDDDPTAEDTIEAFWFVSVPELEVVKRVRCVVPPDPNDPNCAVHCPMRGQCVECDDHLEALPGSTVEFAIEIENTGNVPLAVDVKDVLSGVGTDITPIAGSLRVRHVDGVTKVVTRINDPNEALGVGLCDAFFDDFPTHVASTDPDKPAVCLGILDGRDVCDDPNNLGDRVVIRFKATVSSTADFCSPPVMIDVTNSVTARGDMEVCREGIDCPCPGRCPAGQMDADFEAIDRAGVIDTRREKLLEPPADDNVATINVLCRDVEFVKEVRLLPDPENDGPWYSGDDEMLLPCSEDAYPVTIEYRYRAVNRGETAETVTVRDSGLCSDVNDGGDGVTFDGVCAACGAAGAVLDLPKPAPGGMTEASSSCKVTFQTYLDAKNFMKLDDSRDNTCTFGDPDFGDPDMQCYKNCATFSSAYVPGAGTPPCDSAPPINEARYATICLRPCELTVTKGVRCVENCTSDTDLYITDDSLKVAPGACIEYLITVKNASKNVTPCSLKLTDTMTNRDQFVLTDPTRPNLADISVAGDVPCDPAVLQAAFRFDGTSFTCDGDFPPGDSFTIRFKVQVRGPTDPLYDATKDPDNTIRVDGAPQDCGSNPQYCCYHDDRERIDLQTAGLRCVHKQWSYVDDSSDLNCEPGSFPGSPTFTDDLNLDDAIFPVILRLRIRAENTGQVPLDVTVTDQNLIDCVGSTAGVDLVSPTCELGTNKPIAPSGTADWLCHIRVETAEAFRLLAICDAAGDPPGDPNDADVYENLATLSGKLISGTTGICVSGMPMIPGDNSACDAKITRHRCLVDVTKNAQCVDCSTGVVSGTSQPDSLMIAPGACVQFQIEVENKGKVRLPRICLTDTPDCPEWEYLDMVTADILRPNGTVRQNVNGAFSTFAADGMRRCFGFGAITNPWLDPNEKLRLTFKMKAPAADTFDAGDVGDPVDCTNTVIGEGSTEACDESGDIPQYFCEEPNDVKLDVKVPALGCEKMIAVDVGNNGTIDFGPASLVEIMDTDAVFPMRFIYSVTVRNVGELDVQDVCVRDGDLFDDLMDTLAAGFDVDIDESNCDFDKDPADCMSAGLGAALIALLTKDDGAGGGTDEATVSCEVVFGTRAAWNDFKNRDADDEDNCYRNLAVVDGTPVPGLLCAGPDPGKTAPVACPAELCIEACPCCPPCFRADFRILNQNELPSAHARCIASWDQFLASEPNELTPFDIFFLGTNKAYAQVDGVKDESCDPDSIATPLVGVTAKIVEFSLIGGASRTERSGLNMLPLGQQAAQIIVGRRGDPLVGGGAAPEPATNADEQPVVGPPPPEAVRSHADVVGGPGRKGSLLIYPKVELKWRPGPPGEPATLVQDTFITLVNEHPVHGVDVKMYFVNGDPCVCNALNIETDITKHQPTYWAASTGQPGLGVPSVPVVSFAALDPPIGRPSDDPDDAGLTVVRGYIVLWAVDPFEREIRWNQFVGNVNIVNYEEGSVWQFDAWAFPAVGGVVDGDLLTADNVLNLDGVEYGWASDRLMIDLYATDGMASPFSRNTPGDPTALRHNTDLTLLGLNKDLYMAEMQPGPGGHGPGLPGGSERPNTGPGSAPGGGGRRR